MILEDHSINTVKLFEAKLSSQHCEMPAHQRIRRIIADYTHSNTVFALTEDESDIIVFEAKQVGTNKGDNVECKGNISHLLTINSAWKAFYQ